MKAYAPEFGYKFQLFVRCPGDREFEHCDYATDRADLRHLRTNYAQAYGGGFEFRSKMLPAKYWPRLTTKVA